MLDRKLEQEETISLTRRPGTSGHTQAWRGVDREGEDLHR